jgi:protein-L-isoaspartate O-methyltransferase
MGFYQDQIVPLLINWSMRQRNLTAYRSRIIPAAEGRVLEIGIGSGLNLLFYSRNVTHVIGLEPRRGSWPWHAELSAQSLGP